MPSDHAARPRSQGTSRRLFRASGLVLLVAMTVLAVLLSGCGSSGTTTSGSSRTYSDSDYGFSFEYPKAWDFIVTNLDELPPDVSKSVGAMDQEGSGTDDYGLDFISVDLYELGPDSILTPDTIQSEFESWLESAEGIDSTFGVAAAPTAVTIGGLDGYQATYTYTDTGIEVRCTEYWLLDGEIMYDLYTQASEDNWAANQDIFDAFLDSFTPGTGD